MSKSPKRANEPVSRSLKEDYTLYMELCGFETQTVYPGGLNRNNADCSTNSVRQTWCSRFKL